MLQNTTGEDEFWLHQHSITVKIRENGQNVTADGPMRHVNYRGDQLLELLKGISEFLPDLNLTITGELCCTLVNWTSCGTDPFVRFRSRRSLGYNVWRST